MDKAVKVELTAEDHDKLRELLRDSEKVKKLIREDEHRAWLKTTLKTWAVWITAIIGGVTIGWDTLKRILVFIVRG